MWLFVGILAVLSIFAGRLFELQVIDGKALADKAKDRRLTTMAILADRGSIYDANGQPLAQTVEMRNVTADQVNVTDPAMVAAKLSPLVDVPVADLQALLTGSRRFVYIKKGITPELWRRIVSEDLPGIYSERTTARYYPGGELASNVLGFVNSQGVGSGGLELSLDKTLAGTNGWRTFEASTRGEPIPTGERELVEPKPGSGVRLTLDRDIQYVAQQAIARQIKKWGAKTGSVLVMRPDGRILAMATAPTFNPNDITTAKKDLIGNRMVSEIYEPGSTGKVITLSAVIEEGKANPMSPFVVPSVLPRAGHVFHDHDDHGVLQVTLNGILARSSNIGTILAADRIGPKKLDEYLYKFGIGHRTGLGFPGEEPGLLPKLKNWSGTTFPALSYGQAYSVTSMQQTNVFATIANGGARPVPRLIDGYVDPDGTYRPVPVAPTTRVVSPKTAKAVATMLQSVVTDGTAPAAAIPGYTVAGKTGTAQKANSECGCYKGVTASFIGFAPADNPQVVISVTLQEPQGWHGGGVTAAPVFREVMSYTLQTLRIPPTGAKPARLPVTPGEDPTKNG